MTKWTYDATKTGYARMWDSISIKSTDTAAAARFAKMILKAEPRYRAVQEQTGVPWYFIGALHMRESSCDFKGVLHNGEKIIGTKRKTRLVPPNRGPFATWEASALDVLGEKEHLWQTRVWCPALMGYVAERFNGLGYTGKAVNSPYVWAGSNNEQTGKYVADHVWDKDFDDPQIGVMTVIRAIANMREDIDAELHENHVVVPMRKKPKPVVVEPEPVVEDEPTVEPWDGQDEQEPEQRKRMTTKNKVIIGGSIAGTSTTAVAGGATYFDQIQPFLDVLQNYGTSIALALTIAAAVGAVGWHFYEKYEARVSA